VIAHPKIKMMSSFTQPHVIPNPLDFFIYIFYLSQIHIFNEI